MILGLDHRYHLRANQFIEKKRVKEVRERAMEKDNKRLVIFSPSSVLMKLYMGDNSSFYSPKFRPVKRGRA